MDIRKEVLEPDAFYHVYNRGVNSEKIFDAKENYLFFLKKFAAHINPVCVVYAYCLMPNHFHFLIRVKSKKEIQTFVKVSNFDKGDDDKQQKGLHAFDSLVSKQIGNLLVVTVKPIINLLIDIVLF